MRLKRVLRSKGAVSPVISTILLVNIALAAGILYFAWSQTSLSKSYSVMELLYRSNIERSKEALVFEDARYVSGADYQLTVTVRNIGPIDSRIVALYFNQTDILTNSSDPIVPVGGNYQLLFQARVTFKFRNIPAPLTLHVGDIVNVIIVTERGTRATAQWQVSP